MTISKKKTLKKLISVICILTLSFFGWSWTGKKEAKAYSPPITRVASLQVGSGGDVAALSLSGHYAFASLPAGGISVIDISDPLHPQQVKQYSMATGVHSIAISGNYAYVGTGLNSSGPEFYVFNISDPVNLSITGSLEMGVNIGGHNDVAIAGRYAYVGSDTDNGPKNEFHVIDIQNPASPREVGGFDTSSFDKNSFPINSVSVSGNFAFVTRGTGYNTRNVFSAIDISDPTNPSIVSTAAFGTSINGMGSTVQGNYAYVGVYDSGSVNDMGILDISDPVNLKSVKGFSLGSRVETLYASGKYVFAGRDFNYADPPAPNFMVFDVSNPANAIQLGNLPLGAHATDIVVSGNYAYVTTWGNQSGDFQVIDVSAFTNPDNTHPTVSMDSLGSTPLSGNMTLSATASDDIRVANVLFKVDGSPIGDPVTTPDLDSPFTKVWDTTQIADGTHTLTAVAMDTSGNTTESSGLHVTVSNAGGDRILPIVTMKLPKDGSSNANYILLRADASDNFAIKNVQFKVDGASVGDPVTEAPYKIAWDTSSVADGTHSVTAVATDTANNQKIATAISTKIDNSNKWLTDFSPDHEYYISPNGTGSGASKNDPMSLESAAASANPGDLFWFSEGTYVNGTLDLTRSGTEEKPIVWRALPGEHALINGHIKLGGAYNWVWGFEVTDVNKISSDNGINLAADGARAINNVIHDLLAGGATLGASDGFSGIVAYGNINYGGAGTQRQTVRGHLVYPQNNYAEHGYKYFVNNMFMDPPKEACNFQYDSDGNLTAAQDCFAFHAYTTGGIIQGMNLQKNIFARGRVLIGGYGFPADHEVVNNNMFYKTGMQFGYTRPTQAECRDNYFGIGGIQTDWWWGEGEVQYTQYAPNYFSGNEMYNQNGGSIDLRTSAYTIEGRQEGIAPFQKSDYMDYDKFSSPFSGVITSNNNTRTDVRNLSDWRSLTAAAGNQFDAHSEVVPFPTDNRVFVMPNEYEPGRANVAAYNWSHGANIDVDLSDVLSKGDQYFVYDAENAFGEPRATGTYNGGTVSVSTGGAEFLPLLVTTNGHYAESDLNKDASVNQADLDILKTDFLKTTANLANIKSDINSDGQCTVRDAGIMMHEWKP